MDTSRAPNIWCPAFEGPRVIEVGLLNQLSEMGRSSLALTNQAVAHMKEKALTEKNKDLQLKLKDDKREQAIRHSA